MKRMTKLKEVELTKLPLCFKKLINYKQVWRKV